MNEGDEVMSILSSIMQIDWQDESNASVARQLFSDASEYLRHVERHIYKGNEIRADMWMDFSEKQEEIKKLDRKRTEAHNKLLISAADFIDTIENKSDFKRAEHHLDNRTQIADFISGIAFELLDMKPASTVEGSVRDELAEKIHNGEVTEKMITDRVDAAFSLKLV